MIRNLNRLNWMKNSFLLTVVLFSLLAGLFAACEEVEEVGKYDNWQERNEAFADSISNLVPNGRFFNLYESFDEVEQIPVGEMFALETTASTVTAGKQYVYCKKIIRKEEGVTPLYTDKVSAFYYGTLITGDSFDGNFTGFTALDQGVLDPSVKYPTEFDAPASFSVSGLVVGWVAALQYMHEGERWMLYIPYQSGYGESGDGNILGYSTLAFDLQLNEIVR